MHELNSLFARAVFRFRYRYSIAGTARRWLFNLAGARIHHSTAVSRLRCTWPHQVQIGAGCSLEDDIYFKFDGLWSPGPRIVIGSRVFIGRGCEFNIRQSLHIGDDCLIGSGAKFIDHNHGTAANEVMRIQQGDEAPITIEPDVWVGVNAVILKGITLRQGCIVGAGAIVTKSVPRYEIWAGIPARKIGSRSQ